MPVIILLLLGEHTGDTVKQFSVPGSVFAVYLIVLEESIKVPF